jgi:hypothetical protein
MKRFRWPLSMTMSFAPRVRAVALIGLVLLIWLAARQCT